MRATHPMFLFIIALIMAVIAAIAVAVFLGSGKGPTSADAGSPDLVSRGATVYAKNCAACHGADLEGQPDWRRRLSDGTLPAPPHNADGHSWHHPDALLFDYTKRGGKAVAPPGFKSGMPGFSDVLDDDDIWAVLAFIKSRWPADVQARHRTINQGDD